MSRPAVESTLFRARRRLTEEYDDLVSGARCQRIQSLIAVAGETRLGTRESRRLSRHVAHCQPCRREALAAGLDSAILTHVPLRKRAAEKVAALLPFGWFGRGRDGDDGGAASGWAANAPILSDQLSSGWGKLATAAAVLVAGVGAAGVGTKVVGSGDTPSATDRPAAVERTGAPAQGGSGGTVTKATLGTNDSQKAAKKSRKRDRAEGRSGGREGTGGSAGGTLPVGLSSGDGGAGAGGGTAGGGGKGLPKLELPAGGGNEPLAPVQETVNGVVEGVQPVVDGVTDTVEQTTGTLEDTVEDVGGTVDDATGGGILP